MVDEHGEGGGDIVVLGSRGLASAVVECYNGWIDLKLRWLGPWSGSIVSTASASVGGLKSGLVRGDSMMLEFCCDITDHSWTLSLVALRMNPAYGGYMQSDKDVMLILGLFCGEGWLKN